MHSTSKVQKSIILVLSMVVLAVGVHFHVELVKALDISGKSGRIVPPITPPITQPITLPVTDPFEPVPPTPTPSPKVEASPSPSPSIKPVKLR